LARFQGLITKNDPTQTCYFED